MPAADDPHQELVASSRDYYRDKLAAHGPTARGMDWKDEASQGLRFEVIARHIDWSRSPSLLDVGCGAGEFLAYCEEQGYALDYHGLDVCDEMVAAANARFGREVASTGDLRGRADLGEFDYVIASGTFNVKQDASEEEWRAYLEDSLRAMFAACRVGIVFNAMTAFVDYRYDHLYYTTLAELGELAVSALSRRFVIDHSYPLWELTCAVLRDPERGES